VAPQGARSQAWVYASASLRLGWQITGLWRFDDLWVALAKVAGIDNSFARVGRPRPAAVAGSHG
jgi:hypothetical protein